MQEFNIALLSVGLLVLLVGLLSNRLKQRSLLSETLVALVAGVALGPLGFGLLRPDGWGNDMEIMEELARLTLALSLISTALRLPRGYLRTHWRALAMMLGVVMPLMGLVVGTLGIALLGLPPLMAAILGFLAAPTDPVIASAIVTGDAAKTNIPARLRQVLSAESGANDGLAYPLVLLPILLLSAGPLGQTLVHWFLQVILWEVIGAGVLGALLGLACGRLLRRTRPGKLDEIHLTSVGAIAFVTLAGTKLLGTDGLFAVFLAGVTLKATWGELAETTETQEALNRFFVLPIFVLLGLMMPWNAWLALGWPALWLVIGTLLLRRLPAVLLLGRWIAPIQRSRDAALLGWFGPIGVGALFYATLAVRKTGSDLPWTLGSLLVVASVVVHGLSATPFTRWFGARERSGETSSRQEGEDCSVKARS